MSERTNETTLKDANRVYAVAQVSAAAAGENPTLGAGPLIMAAYHMALRGLIDGGVPIERVRQVAEQDFEVVYAGLHVDPKDARTALAALRERRELEEATAAAEPAVRL